MLDAMGLPIPTILSLEEMYSARVAVWCSQTQHSKKLLPADIPPLTALFQTLGRANRLVLVLHTEGGSISATRALALSLRSAARHLTIAVPHLAKSAGTLLCLASDEIILGSLCEFSAIDPQINAGAEVPAHLPRKISSEDIRAFLKMAETWFDIQTEPGRLEVLKLLSQRFLPTTLGAFFRADQHVRKVAAELLEFQLAGAPAHERARIIDWLVAASPEHRELITGQQLVDLGLKARFAKSAEDTLLQRMMHECHEHMAESMHTLDGPAAIRSLAFTSRNAIAYVGPTANAPHHPEGDDPIPHHRPAGKWQKLRLP